MCWGRSGHWGFKEPPLPWASIGHWEGTAAEGTSRTGLNLCFSCHATLWEWRAADWDSEYRGLGKKRYGEKVAKGLRAQIRKNAVRSP